MVKSRIFAFFFVLLYLLNSYIDNLIHKPYPFS